MLLVETKQVLAFCPEFDRLLISCTSDGPGSTQVSAAAASAALVWSLTGPLSAIKVA